MGTGSRDDAYHPPSRRTCRTETVGSWNARAQLAPVRVIRFNLGVTFGGVLGHDTGAAVKILVFDGTGTSLRRRPSTCAASTSWRGDAAVLEYGRVRRYANDDIEFDLEPAPCSRCCRATSHRSPTAPTPTNRPGRAHAAPRRRRRCDSTCASVVICACRHPLATAIAVRTAASRSLSSGAEDGPCVLLDATASGRTSSRARTVSAQAGSAGDGASRCGRRARRAEAHGTTAGRCSPRIPTCSAGTAWRGEYDDGSRGEDQTSGIHASGDCREIGATIR
jgi:hypothetical protein